MRYAHIALALVLCGATLSPAASAQQRRNDVYAGIELAGDVAARIETTFCDTNLTRTFQGALDGVNAMPERSAEPRLTLGADPMQSFAEIYSGLMESAEARAKIQEAALNGMLHAYDPLSMWQGPIEAYRYRAQGAIGVDLDGSGPFPLVLRIADDSPAYFAGVQPGDTLLEIDGATTSGLRLAEVVTLLRGQINSEISIVVGRNGERVSFTMLRGAIAPPEVTWRLEGNVAIITLPGFQENTGRELRDAIRDIRRDVRRPAGYILDLRNNPGGLLDQVIESADYFIDGGEVVVTRPFAPACHPEDIQRYSAHRNDETDGARLVLLVNRMTSSGAEAFAAALKERRNATLVGQTTFGNARVHTVLPLSGGRDGFLRLSTGVLTATSGATWDQSGLTPDILTDIQTVTVDPAMERAIALLSGAP